MECSLTLIDNSFMTCIININVWMETNFVVEIQSVFSKLCFLNLSLCKICHECSNADFKIKAISESIAGFFDK